MHAKLPVQPHSTETSQSVALGLITTIALLTVLVLSSLAVLADEKVFAQWQTACAPDSVCTAYSPALSGTNARIQFDRDIDNGEAWSVGFSLPAPFPDQSRPVQISIDGSAGIVLTPQSGFALYGDGGALYVKAGRTTAELFGKLKRGNRTRLSYIDVTGAPHDFDFSLDGLSASLLFIAEQQGYDQVGQDIAAPQHLVEQVKQDDAKLIAEQGIPDLLYERHVNGSDCEDPDSTRLSSMQPLIAPLSPVTTLYAIPCTVHAYNITYRLYTVDRGEIGGISPLYFATYSRKFGWSGTDLLFNISYDEASASLSAFYKGRGLADCGNSGLWKWDEYAFRMISFRSHETCDGTSNSDKWEKVFP
ncbi:MAG: DUF1176 domain-containing protein [Stappiaceae bacterium]